MELEAITSISSSELNHRNRLPRLENAFLYTLNGGPSAIPFCSEQEASHFGIRTIDAMDYMQNEAIENEKARIIKYNNQVIKLW